MCHSSHACHQLRVPNASSTIFGVRAQDSGIETLHGAKWAPANTRVTSGPKHAPGPLDGPHTGAQSWSFRQA